MDAHRYPRPQLERKNWTNLNGTWDFAIDADAICEEPNQVKWAREILVPFAPETPASGINDTSFYKAVWYRHRFTKPELNPGERLILHFGAVDWRASVWVNNRLAVVHEGGYTPFSADITFLLNDEIEQEIVLRAEDDPQDFSKPRGKQDWELHNHSIWYPRTTGIWQTVWLEQIGANAIKSVHWTCDVANWEIGLNVEVDGQRSDDLLLSVKLKLKEKVLANDSYRVNAGVVYRDIRLPDPGIEAARDEFLWSPEHPTLISAELTLTTPNGSVVDSVTSYTAMRSVEVDHQRFLLNGRPYELRMVLDQGYWPETGMTAADDAALRHDVELAKLMKFNGVRKHQKIEDPRFLYWADYMGLLVWEEMPSAYAFTRRAVKRLKSTWMEAIDRDSSHPCIVAWVPFNESWGLPDLPKSSAQRDYLKSVFFLTKSLDPSRPVIGNDGWEMVATDIIAIHDYDEPKEIALRFDLEHDKLHQTFALERPGGRVLLLDGLSHEGRAIMLTEFGGICYSEGKGAWGYKRAESPEDLSQRYTELLTAVRALPLLSGFCYTQLTDTYQEANGLLYMDRTPKIPLDQIAQATFGDTPSTFREFSQPHLKGEERNDDQNKL